MGSICPCNRDYPLHHPSGSLSLSLEKGSDESETTDVSTPRHRTKVTLRAEECIGWLTDPLDRLYRLVEEIPVGSSFQRVKSVYTLTQQPVTIDIIPKNDLRNKLKLNTHLLVKLRSLAHPSILALREIMQDTSHLYLVFEDYREGTLENYIAQNGCLSELQAANAIREVLCGLAYAHSRGIAHGSINANTVVVKRERDDKSIDIRISGFERRDFETSTDHSSKEKLFESRETEQGTVSEKTDIWSCGVLLAYMLTGIVVDYKTFTHLVFPGEIWDKLSPDVVSLIAWMLHHKVEGRPTALECISHPWLHHSPQPLTVRSPSVRKSLSFLSQNTVTVSLQAAVAQFLVTRILPESQIESLADVFRTIDLQCDGVISEDELVRSLKKVIPVAKATKKAKKIIAKVDKKRHGLIDYSHFLVAAVNQIELLSINNLKIAFESLDLDGSGSISLQELKRLFVGSSAKDAEAEWKKVVSEYDLSGDEEIDFGEFRVMMGGFVSG